MALFDVLNIVGKVIDKIIPDPAQKAQAQLDLLKLAQNGELEQLHADTQLAQGQLDVDKIEAASSSLLVSGWRPFIGWICGAALAYASIVEPLARFIASVVFHYIGSFPVIDTALTMQLLVGLLGLGGMRTYEKVKGAA